MKNDDKYFEYTVESDSNDERTLPHQMKNENEDFGYIVINKNPNKLLFLEEESSPFWKIIGILGYLSRVHKKELP